jgi:hypothetical protein
MIEPAKTTKQTSGRIAGQVVPFRPGRTAPRPEAAPLIFTWEMLEQQLSDLAVTPTQRGLVHTLVSGTRKQARFKPSEQVLREVLCLASVLMDETFHPDSDKPQKGEGEMT